MQAKVASKTVATSRSEAILVTKVNHQELIEIRDAGGFRLLGRSQKDDGTLLRALKAGQSEVSQWKTCLESWPETGDFWVRSYTPGNRG